MTDLFGSDSAPAISFNGAAVGTVRTVIVTDEPELVHGNDFATGTKAYWPSRDGQPGGPVMSVVIKGTNEQGEPCSVWAKKPSDLRTKIGEAQTAVRPGYTLSIGDTLAIKLVERKPSGKGNPQSIYAVKITPGNGPAKVDPFADTANTISSEPPF